MNEKRRLEACTVSGNLATTPWKAHIRVSSAVRVFGADGSCVGTIFGHDNVRRLIACVNACAGIDDATLVHAGVVQRGELVDVLRQRDQLLAALKGAVSQMELAADAIEAGRYDEALLHARSLMREKRTAIAAVERAE